MRSGPTSRIIAVETASPARQMMMVLICRFISGVSMVVPSMVIISVTAIMPNPPMVDWLKVFFGIRPIHNPIRTIAPRATEDGNFALVTAAITSPAA